MRSPSSSVVVFQGLGLVLISIGAFQAMLDAQLAQDLLSLVNVGLVTYASYLTLRQRRVAADQDAKAASMILERERLTHQILEQADRIAKLDLQLNELHERIGGLETANALMERDYVDLKARSDASTCALAAACERRESINLG